MDGGSARRERGAKLRLAMEGGVHPPPLRGSRCAHVRFAPPFLRKGMTKTKCRALFLPLPQEGGSRGMRSCHRVIHPSINRNKYCP